MIAKQEGREIQCQIRVLFLLGVDYRGDVHLSDDDLVRFEPSIDLRIILQVFEQNFESPGGCPGKLVEGNNRDQDGQKRIDHRLRRLVWQIVSSLGELKEEILKYIV